MITRRKACAVLAGAFCANSLFHSAVVAQPLPDGGNAIDPEMEKLKTEADVAYRARKFPQTIALTTRVLQKNPKDHVALYLRGSARVEQGVLTSDAKVVRAGVGDARNAISLAGSDQAMYYLPYLYGMTSLAQLENTKAHAESSRKFAGRVLTLKTLTADDRAHLHFQRANASAFLRDHKAAAADYQQAIKLSNTHLGAYVGLADSYALSGQKQLAQATFDQAVKQFPDNPLVYNNRGMWKQREGKLTEAIADFTRAIKVDADFYQARTNRGFVLMQQGDAARAEIDYTASLKSNPNQPNVLSMRGAAKLDQGKTREAIADYRAVISMRPKNPMAHADLGFSYFFVGDFRTADTSLRQALTLMPSMTFLRPWVYVAQARRGAANPRGYKKILPPADKRGWPDHLLAYLVGEIDAKTLKTKAEPNDPGLRAAHLCEADFFIGQKMLMAGQRQEATTAFEAATKSSAKHLSAHRGARYAIGRVRIANK